MLRELGWAFLWHLYAAILFATGSDLADVKMSNAGNQYMRLCRIREEA